MILKEDLIILHGSFVFLNQLGSIRKFLHEQYYKDQ